MREALINIISAKPRRGEPVNLAIGNARLRKYQRCQIAVTQSWFNVERKMAFHFRAFYLPAHVTIKSRDAHARIRNIGIIASHDRAFALTADGKFISRSPFIFWLTDRSIPRQLPRTEDNDFAIVSTCQSARNGAAAGSGQTKPLSDTVSERTSASSFFFVVLGRKDRVSQRKRRRRRVSLSRVMKIPMVYYYYYYIQSRDGSIAQQRDANRGSTVSRCSRERQPLAATFVAWSGCVLFRDWRPMSLGRLGAYCTRHENLATMRAAAIA